MITLVSSYFLPRANISFPSVNISNIDRWYQIKKERQGSFLLVVVEVVVDVLVVVFIKSSRFLTN